MGEIIRSHGLATAVGVVDASGQVRPSYCASACVFVYAGGNSRYGIEGSMLGVHRFVASTPGGDPVAETQRITGMVLGYMTKMGVSSSVVEAMSETRDVRWLGAKEAATMNLVTILLVAILVARAAGSILGVAPSAAASSGPPSSAPARLPDVIVCPISSRPRYFDRPGPGDLPLQHWKKAGLRYPSTARDSKVVSVSKQMIARGLGRVAPQDLRRVQDTFREALGL